MTELNAIQWAGLVIGGLSVLAAWFGAVVSWRNHRHLRMQSRLRLRGKIEQAKAIRSNGTRQLSRENVRVRILNVGRPIEIEFAYFDTGNQGQLAKGLYQSFKDARSRSRQLETHRSLVLQFPSSSILSEVESRSALPKRVIVIRLADGAILRLRPRGTRKALGELFQFKADLDAGYELELPDRYIQRSGLLESIELYAEREIPADCSIVSLDGKSICAEEEAIWRSGRNPQREQIDAARSRRPAASRTGIARWLHEHLLKIVDP